MSIKHVCLILFLLLFYINLAFFSFIVFVCVVLLLFFAQSILVGSNVYKYLCTVCKLKKDPHESILKYEEHFIHIQQLIFYYNIHNIQIILHLLYITLKPFTTYRTYM